jgi:ferredoxin
VEAIRPDTELGLEQWLKLNAEYARKWPNIVDKGMPPSDAATWDGVPDKYATHFSNAPARQK